MPKPKTTDLNNALAKISEVKKPKKKQVRTKGPGTLAQKKRTSASHNRTRKVKEETNLANITKAIIREGGTIPDIGVILGCAAIEGGEDWLTKLKTKNLSIEEFLEAAKNRADIELIRVAIKAAAGYSWVDTEEDLEPVVNEEGKETGKFAVVKKRRKPKHQSSDTGLLKFILTSRMPEYFQDVKHIKIDKRTVVEMKDNAEQEIRGFASGLLKALGEEVIEVEFTETAETDK